MGKREQPAPRLDPELGQAEAKLNQAQADLRQLRARANAVDAQRRTMERDS